MDCDPKFDEPNFQGEPVHKRRRRHRNPVNDADLLRLAEEDLERARRALDDRENGLLWLRSLLDKGPSPFATLDEQVQQLARERDDMGKRLVAAERMLDLLGVVRKTDCYIVPDHMAERNEAFALLGQIGWSDTYEHYLQVQGDAQEWLTRCSKLLGPATRASLDLAPPKTD